MNVIVLSVLGINLILAIWFVIKSWDVCIVPLVIMFFGFLYSIAPTGKQTCEYSKAEVINLGNELVIKAKDWPATVSTNIAFSKGSVGLKKTTTLNAWGCDPKVHFEAYVIKDAENEK